MVKTMPKIERLAVHYLEDLVYDQIFAEVEALRTSQITELLGGGMTAHPAAVRQLLAHSSRVFYMDRRWHLTARHRLRRRSADGALRTMLEMYGKPLGLETLASEFEYVFQRPKEHFLPVLGELARSLPDEYIFIASDTVALRDWFFVPPKGATRNHTDLLPLEQAVKVDTLEEELADPLIQEGESPGKYIDRLSSALGEPAPNTVVGYLLWKKGARLFNPGARFAELLQDRQVNLFSGCGWCGNSLMVELRASLTSLLETLRKAAPKMLERAMDVPKLIGEAAARGERAELDEREIEEAVEMVSRSRRPLRLEEILAGAFELTPEDEEFPRYGLAVADAFSARPAVLPVGQYRWTLSKAIPNHILGVPDTLKIEEVTVVSAEGEDVDVELSDDGIEPSLLDFVSSLELEDVGDCDPPRKAIKMPEKPVPYVLPYHHFREGTAFVRSIDRGVLPSDPRLFQAVLRYREDEEYPIWLNNEFRLLFGLREFYQNHCTPSGCIFTIRQGEREGELWVECDGSVDSQMAVPDTRIRELGNLKERAKEAEFSVLDIIQEVMTQHQHRMHIKTLYAEANLVRRTRRRMLASILSCYHCFTETKKGQQWQFDPRRVSQGMKRAKKKYVVR